MPPIKKAIKECCQEAIQEAIQYYQRSSFSENPVSIQSTARRFGLPESTLRRVLQNGIPTHSGPITVLTAEEEEELVGYCLNMQQLGFGLTKSSVNYAVLQMVKGRGHPFSEKGPAQAWWTRFMKDHPELSFRKPQAFTAARAQKGNPIIINDHYNKLQRIVIEHSLKEDQIWNMDETGFSLSSRLQHVLAKKNSRSVSKVAASNTTDHISVVSTISAAGISIPPLIIYTGKRVIENLLEGAPPGTVMGFTEKGYMQESLFNQYIEHFIKSIPATRPALLMLDGHKSHINISSLDICRENQILLYALPSNTTHLLQPCELPFRKLKLEFDKASEQYRNNNNGAIISKYSFAKVFGEAYQETYTSQAIINAFKHTGAWPINPNAISKERLAPSMPTQRSPITDTSTSNASTTDNNMDNINIDNLNDNDIEVLKEIIRKQKEEIRLLKEENERLKHPGSASLATILKYPMQKPKLTTNDTELTRRKSFPFTQLVTAEDTYNILKKKDEEEKEKRKHIEERKVFKAKRKDTKKKNTF